MLLRARKVLSLVAVLALTAILGAVITFDFPIAATLLDENDSSLLPNGNGYPTRDAITYHGQSMLIIPSGHYYWSNSPLSQQSHHLSMYLPTFAMHRTEVTNAAFMNFVRDAGYQTLGERAGDPMTWRTAFRTGQDEYPVSLISYQDAEAFCGHYGLRLPTVYEWERAAGGPNAYLWPWGNVWDLQRTNSLERAEGSTIPVGTEPQGASPYGLLDMAGNVWEWTSSEYSATDTEIGFMDTSAATFAGERILKGGSWRTLAPGTQVTYRKPAAEEYRRDTTGFRCAVDGIIVAAASDHPTDTGAVVSSLGPRCSLDIYREPDKKDHCRLHRLERGKKGNR